jgi:serine/threonine-protein kinase RsbW
MVMQSNSELTPTELAWPGAAAWARADLSCSADVVPFLDHVEAAMAAQAYPTRTCWEVRLILGEAITNGLRHGNRGDPSRKVRVVYRVLPEAVLANVEDEGPGFDPAAFPDPTAPENWERPCGQGLLLMRHFSTSLRFHGRGNRVSLCKCRPTR